MHIYTKKLVEKEPTYIEFFSHLIKLNYLNFVKNRRVPFIFVKTSSKKVSHRKQPTITMHSNQWKPIYTIHPIPCKIYPKSWLWEFRWNFVSWKIDFPCFVRMSIQTQIFLFYKRDANEFKTERDVNARQT